MPKVEQWDQMHTALCQICDLLNQGRTMTAHMVARETLESIASHAPKEEKMSYDLPVKRCFNLDDHAEHSWDVRGELHKCPGMPLQVLMPPWPRSGREPGQLGNTCNSSWPNATALSRELMADNERLVAESYVTGMGDVAKLARTAPDVSDEVARQEFEAERERNPKLIRFEDQWDVYLAAWQRLRELACKETMK